MIKTSFHSKKLYSFTTIDKYILVLCKNKYILVNETLSLKLTQLSLSKKKLTQLIINN
jgi:hypothetical protein